jgi:hypothetical protein
VRHVIEAGVAEERRARSGVAAEVLILVGALLVAGSVFLPWFNAGVGISSIPFDRRGWAQTEVAWPLFTCSAVAIVGLVAPARWLRYPFAMLAAGAAAGVGYSWWFNRVVGPLLAMLSATLVLVGAFVGLAPRSGSPPPSFLTRRGSILVIVGVLVMLLGGYLGPEITRESVSCTSRSSSTDGALSAGDTLCHTSPGSPAIPIALAVVGGIVAIVGLTHRTRSPMSSPESPRIDA